MVSAPVRWGILSTGSIARGFATNLAVVPDADIAAVGSRSVETATAFARTYGDDRTRVHGSAEGLATDPDVDVVYVASPHTLHLEHALLAIEAGKAVLCEKPLALNAHQATQMVRRARDRGVFLMEGMWMACNPVIRALRSALAEGRFGEPRQVHADLGFVVDRPVTDRLMAPDLGGGALLDMGVYPLTFAHLMLGPAVDLSAVATLTDTGIDLDVAIACRYRDGAVAALTASMTSTSPRAATVATTTGLIEVPSPFHHPPYVVFTPTVGEPTRLEGADPLIGSGLGNEAAEVQRCLREGLLESPLVPHEQSLTLMRQMDEIRAQIGVTYAEDGHAA
jgi:predicted dehydrogenase